MSERVISVIVLTVFCFTSQGLAGEAPATTNLPFSIPEELAHVEKVNAVSQSRGPWVIHIQDPHCIVEAQLNISQLIQYLQETYGICHVYLEGGEGKLDPSRMKELPRQEVLNDYLAGGQLSGAELAAILSPVKGFYYGIEDTALFQANREAFRRVIETRDERNRRVKSVLKSFKAKREGVLSSRLIALDEQEGFYVAGGFPLAEFFPYLAWMFSEELKDILSPGEFPRLHQLMTVYLKDPAAHKEMISRKGYYEEEVRKLLEKLRGALISSREEQDLAKAIHEARILSLASQLALSRDDFDTFRNAYAALTTREPELAKLFSPVIKFYELVLKRDEVMARNVLKRFDVDQPRIAVLVTGGFHSEGIDRILASRNISTVVVTPNFSDLKGKENYIPVLEKRT